MPHGHCYYWRPEIQWLHVLSDSLIAISYYSIPLTLFYFVRRRRDLPFNWMFLMFAAFILLCGTTHLLEIWSVWHGTYRFTGLVKLATGLVSVVTAIQLFPLVPKALAMPSAEVWRRELTERRELERQLIEISAEEHRKLGEDLHDGVGQQLTGILLIGQKMTRTMGENNPLAHDLNTIVEAARLAQQQVRSLSKGLLPVEVEARGLVGSLEEMAQRGAALFQKNCRFKCEKPITMSQPVSIQIYKIAQEALHNAAKHGKADRIEIELIKAAAGVILTVSDNGVGIPEEADRAGGSGVRMMRHRARIINADLTLRRAEGGGTVVRLVVPGDSELPRSIN